MFNKSFNAVEIKGYGSDVNIILNNESDFADIEADLINKLDMSDDFFAGREIVLDLGERILSLEDCSRLDEILKNTFTLTISKVYSIDSETRKVIEEFGWELADKKHKKDKGDNKVNINNSDKNEKNDKNIEVQNVNNKNDRPVNIIQNLNNTYLHKGTIRGGQKKIHRGNIVIIGDVNPGAVIIATGDIIVIGKLRGVAHAGAEGDTSATIIALDLQPIQLRIAGCIGRSPDAGIEKSNEPEIAEIEEGQIVIHKLR